MARSSVLTLILFVIVTGLSACSSGGNSTPAPPSPSPRETPAPTKNSDPVPAIDNAPVKKGWRPDKVAVKCGADRCPPQVGALIFVETKADGTQTTHRCTAFLIEPDAVMSNGHCDSFGRDKGFFVSQMLNGKKQIREISGVLFKEYTADTKDPRGQSTA